MKPGGGHRGSLHFPGFALALVPWEVPLLWRPQEGVWDGRSCTPLPCPSFFIQIIDFVSGLGEDQCATTERSQPIFRWDCVSAQQCDFLGPPCPSATVLVFLECGQWICPAVWTLTAPAGLPAGGGFSPLSLFLLYQNLLMTFPQELRWMLSPGEDGSGLSNSYEEQDTVGILHLFRRCTI